jgi:hypothetical protein
MKALLSFMLATAIFLSGCNALLPTPAPTATPIPTDTPVPPTATLAPTKTPAPTATKAPPTATKSPPTATNAPTNTPGPTATNTKSPVSPTPKDSEAIKIYFPAKLKGSSGPLCNGYTMLYVNTGIAKTANLDLDLKTALYRLFLARWEKSGNLYNPLSNATFAYDTTDFKGGSAVVHLSGTWRPTKDKCDGILAAAQVRATIRQFPEIKSIDHIWVGSSELGDVTQRKAK